MTGHDVEARLRRAADGLPELPDRLDEVRRRGGRRRTAARAGAVVTAVAAVVLGAVIVLPSGDRPPAPIVEEPGPEPTPTMEPSPSPDASPDPSPTPSPTDELATVAPAELPWGVVTSTPDGVHLWEDGEAQLLGSEPVERLRWLPETGAVGQRAPGEPIVRLGPGAGDGAELVGARDGLLLEAAGVGPDGREVLLVTWTRPAAELSPEIVLGIVDVASGAADEFGVVGNREDGPDGMAVDDDGVVWATCHLQCTLATLPLSEGGDQRREIAAADWRAGVALAGDTVATVAFTFDPEEGRPSAARLVLHDRATGAVRREVALAGTESWDVDLSLSTDGTAALVMLGSAGDTQVYVVDGLPDRPRVRLLRGTGRAVFADQ